MPQIKLRLVNQTKFNVIFDYKTREYYVPFEFDKAVEVESGSLLYVFPEGKPDDYQQTNQTLETDTEIVCSFEFGRLSLIVAER